MKKSTSIIARCVSDENENDENGFSNENENGFSNNIKESVEKIYVINIVGNRSAPIHEMGLEQAGPWIQRNGA